MPPLPDEHKASYHAGEYLSGGWLWLGLMAALLWLFSPGLFWSQVPAFRDAYHFYYPQAVWLERCAEHGSLFPTWNPNEGLGVSVAGQPTAALYYPLRIIWWTPGLSVAQCFSLFIVVHLLIAAAGMRYAAAKLNLSENGRWLAAIGFCLSGPVFFQLNNPIYLCSAAWIGFAVGALLHSLCGHTHPIRDSLIFAVACSLMLLAGDPHTAINTFIIGGLIRLTTWFIWPIPGLKRGLLPVLNRVWSNVRWFAVAVALFAALTAIQTIPAWRHALRSGRAQAAISVTTTGLPHVDAVLQQSEPAKHRIYDFSLSPWHLATLLWPTVGGDYLPNNARLFAALPAEGRMWIPAIYLGCLPILLVLSAVVNVVDRCVVGRVRRSERQRTDRGAISDISATLLVAAAFSLLAAFGSYTLVWLLRESLSGVGLRSWTTHLPPDPISGVYWLLSSVIPAYDMFRYPAKWTVWFVAACSLLAACQLSNGVVHSTHPVSPRLRRIVQLLSGLGMIVAIAFWLSAITSNGLDRWLTTAAPDSWLGPPDGGAVALALLFAFALPLCIVSLRIPPKFYAALTLAEMTLCASCWVSFIAPPPSAEFYAVPITEGELTVPVVWADRGEADLLRDRPQVSPKDFLRMQAEYQQIFMLGKLSALSDIRCLSATQSIEPASLSTLRNWLGQHDHLTESQPKLDGVLRELGVTHRLTRQRLLSAPASFTWLPISDPAPLCELLKDGSVRGESDAAVTWNWHRCDMLEVQLLHSHAGQLLIRQWNDGGWLAHGADGQKLQIDSSQMLLVVSLKPSDKQVHLSRKWLW